MRALLRVGSSTFSPALPIGTCPRLLMFSENFEVRLRMDLGAGCHFIAWEYICSLFLSCSGTGLLEVFRSIIRERERALKHLEKGPMPRQGMIFQGNIPMARFTKRKAIDNSERGVITARLYSSPRSRGGRIKNTDQAVIINHSLISLNALSASIPELCDRR